VSPGGTTIILKGAPNGHSAKLLVNWLLSREGQISLHAASSLLPMRPELKRKEFLPFAEHILGKKEAFLDPNLEEKSLPQLLAFWNDLWLRGGKPSR
jgi:ABC-type Fe3+ transport system substrate-binding protein